MPLFYVLICFSIFILFFLHISFHYFSILRLIVSSFRLSFLIVIQFIVLFFILNAANTNCGNWSCRSISFNISIWINFNPFSFFHCSFPLQNQIQFHLSIFWFQSFQSILIPTHLLSFWYWSIHCNVNQNIFENNAFESEVFFIFQHWIKP